MELLAVASVFGYALLLGRFFKWKTGESLLPVICAIVCTLFLAGTAGVLAPVARVLLGCGLVFLACALPGIWAQRGRFAQLDRATLFFIALAAGLYLLTRIDFYAQLHSTDDFSHWARVSRVIHLNDRLLISSDPVFFKDYPPGTGLLDYFFSQATAISPGSMFYAHAMVVIAAISGLLTPPLTAARSTRPFPWSVLTFTALALNTFTLAFHSLGADLLIATLMGAGVALYWKSDRSWGAVARVFPLVMALPLLKSAGVLIGAVVVLAVVADQVLKSVRQRRPGRLLLLSICLVPALLLSSSLWSHQQKKTQAAATFAVPTSLRDVVRGLSPSTATELQKTVTRNFLGEFSPELFGKRFLRPAAWTIFLFGMLAVAVRRAESLPGRRREMTVTLSVLSGGLLVYLASLLILYVFMFGSYEGPRLASFGRYLNIFFLGLAIFFFAVLLEQRETAAQPEGGRRFSVLAIVLLCAMASFYKSAFLVLIPVFFIWQLLARRVFRLKPAYQTGVMWAALLLCYGLSAGYGIRGYVRELAAPSYKDVSRDIETAARFVPPGKRVYFVSQGDDGYRLYRFNYGILPLGTNRGCDSVGDAYGPQDVWTCPAGLQQFEAMLKDHDYVMLSKSDAAFHQKFGRLFPQPAPDGTLYQVSWHQGTPRLAAIAARQANRP